MRFHLLGLAHLPTNEKVQACAYTQKIVKLARILRNILGHEVFFYGSEGSEVECDRQFTVGLASERQACYGDYNWRREFFKHDPKDFCHRAFNARAVAEINAQKKDRDILLCPMGNYHQPIADAVRIPLTVEPGIGYTGVFSKYRVFESSAWMHYVYGLINQHDGGWYDAVIPNYWDPSDFELGRVEPKGSYFLYIGRLISRKGVSIAVEVTEKLGTRLVVAGQGDLSNVDGMDLRRPHVVYAGTVDKGERAKLMGGAIATFVPTSYLAPFEGVHVESMLTGTPVITSDWGVFRETVMNGFEGFRCRTFEEFVRAARMLTQDPVDRGAVVRHAVERFSMERVAPMYQQYFERLQDLYGKGWYQEHGRELFADD